MVKGIEDLRTPLGEIIALDKKIRGTLSGFMMPAFVVDLPGGGGKRLVSTHESYNEKTGVAKYTAPGLDGTKGTREYFYNDPKPVVAAELAALRAQKAQALRQGRTLEQVAQSPVTIPHRIERPTPARKPTFGQDVRRVRRDSGTLPKRSPQVLEVNNYDYSNAMAAARL
jgi:lysine 2,3-aminomutase